MIDERDWLDFHDGLDALARGDADDALQRRLETLAPRVPDGETMLALARRLGEDRLADLASRAPDHLVDATWSRLEAALPSAAESSPSTPRPVRRVWSTARTWTGLAAAAVVALVFLTGYLTGERRQLRQRLAAWEDVGSPVAGDREATLSPADRAWTVAELSALLDRLPDGAVLADAEDLDRLLVAGPLLRRAPARRLLDRHAAADGLTVAEARRLLAELAAGRDTELDLRDLRLEARVLSY